MKKTISIFLLFVMGITFVACAPNLPDGIDENTLTDTAHTVISNISADNFEQIETTMSDELLKVADAQYLRNSWQEYAPNAGYLQEIKHTQLTTIKGFAVAVVSAVFEDEKTYTFTLSYDENLNLAGIYFK